MIDFKNEKVIGLLEAAGLFAKPVSLSTIHRWVVDGAKAAGRDERVYLEGERVGG